MVGRLERIRKRAPDSPSGTRVDNRVIDGDVGGSVQAPLLMRIESYGVRHRLIGALVIVFFATASS